jgi:hypothetical protein
MFSLLDLVEKAREKAAKVPVFMSKLADSARNLTAGAGESVKGRGGKIRNPIPPGIRKKLPWLEGKFGFALIGLGLALFLLLAAALVMVFASNARPTEDREREPPWRSGDPGGLTRDAPIPPEELFLPDEPDFLPGVILERERRDLWTAEDAEPYWYNPLEKGEELWRDRIRTVLDELLEHIP